MRFTSFRNMSWLIVAILLASLSIFFTSSYFMKQGFDSHFEQDMATMRKVVANDLANLHDRLLQEVIMLSHSVELEKAFQTGDGLLLSKMVHDAKERFRASFATVTDAKGNVLARGHSNKRGDNISQSTVMQQALIGNPMVDVVRFQNNGLSVGAAAPVIINGQIVGALLFGEAFRSHTYVDRIKQATNLEMTVFDHDMRISTTLMRQGMRAVGTRLDNSEVFSSVLEGGNAFEADADILGRAYKTVYWPMRDSRGKILGMWFIGTEVEGLQKIITAIAVSCLAATLIIAAALSALGIAIFRSLINPLEKRAYVDMLTGITNRAGFEKALDFVFRSRPKSGALFLIDLDNFKMLNDTLGHPVGDECLKRTAYLLKEVFRETDIVARLGGDEFIVFAPTLNEIDVIEEKAQEFLDDVVYKYILEKGQELVITASIGIALYPRDGRSYTPLYNHADSALYAAKRSGRNKYALFEE